MHRLWITVLCLYPLSFCLPVAARGDALTTQQRIKYQQAIETVYWQHRLWPKENIRPKPKLNEILDAHVISQKALETVEKSNVLQEVWGKRITHAELQAEMARMARQTRRPDFLRELFAALDNNATVIAEVLGRSVLSDRLIRSRFAYDPAIHSYVRTKAETEYQRIKSATEMRQAEAVYREIIWEKANDSNSQNGSMSLNPQEWNEATTNLRKILAPASLTAGVKSKLQEDETRFYAVGVLEDSPNRIRIALAEWPKRSFDEWWNKTPKNDELRNDDGPSFAYEMPQILNTQCNPNGWLPTPGPPDPRYSHAAVWTGTEMIVWGGYRAGFSYGMKSGGRYDPSTDSWTPTNIIDGPAATSPTAVWTGSLMLVWGAEGARYDPVSDAWTPMSQQNQPSPRNNHSAVWTGSEMIIWGGIPNGDCCWLGDGARYNPTTDTWQPVSLVDAPVPRAHHTAIWTGSQMIVWGGGPQQANGTGGRYNPDTDTWQAINVSGPPLFDHTAVWTGVKMIVWGGLTTNGNFTNTGGIYDPQQDSWTPTSTINAPIPRAFHVAGWTGSKMIVWGGWIGPIYTNTGGVFDPFTNQWQATTLNGAPSGRQYHTGVWTGQEFIVWGGYAGLDDGGRYQPNSDQWIPVGPANTPIGRAAPGIWTGSEMIVWGGDDLIPVGQTGAAYDPALYIWRPTSLINAPSSRDQHSMVWTGQEAIVWGGFNGNFLNDGARYNPISDSWITMSMENAPTARSAPAVWTGQQMLIWGGFSSPTTGGKYNPAADFWEPINPQGAPFSDGGHSLIWTGTEMLVCGSLSLSGNGGRYRPDLDSWEPLSCPLRKDQSAIWTGTEMILWGGWNNGYLNSGQRFDPVSNSWQSISQTNAPEGRAFHSAVWTGSEMLIWGGNGEAIWPHLNTGSAYNPAQDSWLEITTTAAPSARAGQSTAWTDQEMIVWGGATDEGLTHTGAQFCVDSGISCAFGDDFDDGTVDPAKWTIIKPKVTESGGDMLLTPAKRKALVISSGFAGCGLNCTINTYMQTAGGALNKVWTLGWFVDKKNTIEVLMKQENNKWILRQRVNNTVVTKAKVSTTINPNQSYHVVLTYDGTKITLNVDGADLTSITPAGPLNGTVGFQAQNTTAHVAGVCVK